MSGALLSGVTSALHYVPLGVPLRNLRCIYLPSLLALLGGRALLITGPIPKVGDEVACSTPMYM